MIALYLGLIETEEEKNRFEELYNKYRKLMKYTAINILKDEYLAEDAVHNAFLKIIDHLDKIEDISCHKTVSFIVIITRNTSLDMYSKRKRQSTLNIDDLNDSRQVSEELDLSKLDMEIIVSSIENLSQIHKDVLLLKYFHERSDKEICEI